MRIVFIVLASIVVALHVPVAYGAETLVCDYKEKFRDGGWREAGVTLTLQGNAVTGISYHNAIASGKEGGGYVCAFDASVSDGNSTWTRQNGLTLVELKSDKKPPSKSANQKKDSRSDSWRCRRNIVASGPSFRSPSGSTGERKGAA